jgi:hypothetical protein
MPSTVFYSWQSDLPSSTNRGFILDALESAAAAIGADPAVAVEPVVERDTAGVAGSPDIAGTILEKIRRADVFVPDVSLITPEDAKRRSPNPNVLIELGYAIAELGWERIVMVMNIAFGDPSSLPFDLRGRRVLQYSCPDVVGGSKAPERNALATTLSRAISAILTEQGRRTESEISSRREVASAKARQFQAERLARLSSGRAPVALSSDKLICVHVVPYDAVPGKKTIDVSALDGERTRIPPIGSTGFDTRFNSDGLLRVNPGAGGKIDSYLQVFRDGRIESVDSRTMIGRGREDGLPGPKSARDLVSFLGHLVRLIDALEMNPPIAVELSLSGLKGAPLLVEAADVGRGFDQDLLLAEIVIGDLKEDVRQLARPALDIIWQAAGSAGCPYYDDAGRWTLK